jgi:uncharacterized membrane protein YeiH
VPTARHEGGDQVLHRTYARAVETSVLTVTLDLAGVFVFALAGALAAVRKRLDVVGVVVIGMVTALGGGLLRDVLLGDVPPAALRDWRYLMVPAVAGTLVFFFHPYVGRMTRSVRVLDAAGLGLFATSGTAKALDVGLGPVPACLIGVLTGVGGGLLRDVILVEIPLVLSDRELYAVSALAGTVVVAVGEQVDAFPPSTAAFAVLVVFVLRIVAIRRRWEAPTPRGVDG